MEASESLTQLVLNTLSVACNVPPSLVTAQTRLSDIGMDSIGFTAVITRIETAYQRELPIESIMDLFKAKYVNDLVSRLSLVVGEADVLNTVGGVVRLGSDG
jgi:acyl carrier protein